MQNFGTLRQFLNLPPLSPQICDSAGGRGGHQLVFFIGILIILLLRSTCKFSNSYDMPLLGFSNGGKNKKRKEKKPGSAHARPSARPPIDTSGNFPAPVSAEWLSAFKTVKISFSPIFRSK